MRIQKTILVLLLCIATPWQLFAQDITGLWTGYLESAGSKIPYEVVISSNGDKWEITEDDDKRLFIRHTPSEASGGRQRILTIESFLEPGLGGPEQSTQEAYRGR